MQKRKIILSIFIVFFCLTLIITGIVSFSSKTAETNLSVKSIYPFYDENSDVIVSQNDIIFNDKNQTVKYNVVIANNNNYDVKISNINFSIPTEEFLKFEVEGLNKDDVLKPNETKEIIVTFETQGIDGWGRNFDEELQVNVLFDNMSNDNNPSLDEDGNLDKEDIPNDNLGEGNVNSDEKDDNNKTEEPEKEESKVENPNTSDESLIGILCIVAIITSLIIFLVSKKRIPKYMILLLLLIVLFNIVKAKDGDSLSLKFNVSFKSQNVMKKTGCDVDLDNFVISNCDDYWAYNKLILNYYIVNKIESLENVVHEFDVSEKGNGRVKAYLVSNKDYPSAYDLYLQADGIIYPNTDASIYFADMENLFMIHNLAGMDTSEVTNMLGMFFKTGFNVPSFKLDLKDLNTSNVINMAGMFAFTAGGSNDVVLNLTKLDTSKVTDMTFMFYGTGYNSKNFDLDLSNFNTSNVKTMYYMFQEIAYLNQNFTLDVSSFDTRNVEDFSGMFFKAGYNSQKLTLDVSNFDTKNATNMYSMFNQAGVANPNFMLKLGDKFDTSKVSDMSYMFKFNGYNNSEFNLDLTKLDTKNALYMNGMFYGTGYSSNNFTLDLSNFDTSKVLEMNSMFKETGYSSLNLDIVLTISNPKVEKYSNVFYQVATRGDSKVTVNYTEETIELVDKMLNEKSSNSNVVKGQLVSFVNE